MKLLKLGRGQTPDAALESRFLDRLEHVAVDHRRLAEPVPVVQRHLGRYSSDRPRDDGDCRLAPDAAKIVSRNDDDWSSLVDQRPPQLPVSGLSRHEGLCQAAFLEVFESSAREGLEVLVIVRHASIAIKVPFDVFVADVPTEELPCRSLEPGAARQATAFAIPLHIAIKPIGEADRCTSRHA